MIRKGSKIGFTLIEVIVAVIIIGGVAAIAIPNYQSLVLRIKNQEAETILIVLVAAQKEHVRALVKANPGMNSFLFYVREMQAEGFSHRAFDVVIPPLKHFKNIIVTSQYERCQGYGMFRYLAKMEARDGSYTLYGLDDGQIACFPCPSTKCSKMGYGMIGNPTDASYGGGAGC